MTDLPPGKYSALLVGPWWPDAESVMALVNAARNRGVAKSIFEDYASQLANTRNVALAPMEGATADALTGLLRDGEKHATAVSDKNGVKQESLNSSGSALNDLRSALGLIAEIGNAKIDKIIASSETSAIKLANLIETITTSQEQAAHVSTQFGSPVLKAIQAVLTAEGDTRTLEEFSRASGFDLSGHPTPATTESIHNAAENLLKNSSQGAAGSAPKGESATDLAKAAGGGPTNQGLPKVSELESRPPAESATGHSPGPPNALPTKPSEQVDLTKGRMGVGSVPGINVEGGAPPTPGGLPGGPAPSTGGVQIMGTPTTSLPGGHSGLSAPSMAASGGGIPGGTGIPSGGLSSPLAPENLAQSFNNGFQSGAPLSNGTEALSHAFTPVAHQPEFSTPTGTLSAATAPTSGGYASESSYAGATSTVAPMAAAPSPTMFAGPLAAAGQAAPPPMAPAGPLPTYGADLRAGTPAITPGAPPAPMAPSASTPSSAPVNPSSGSGLGQPAVVNKVPAHAASAPSVTSPTGLTESAVAATGSGAAAGAAAAHNAAQARLRHLLDSVARQQPHLHWAIGERDDGTTVLVTDLASGWIPPNIDVPSGVHLLPPAFRRGGLEALLGDAVVIEAWTPGQFIPAEKDDQPVATSLRARDLPAVNDLNWELTQATNWRDGLPRLAHTLTKAGIAGTGILDAETDLLAEHLRAISEKVLRSYPDSVDTEAVGNWQLLAAIDALVNGQKTALNYHFAWFQALQHGKAGG